MMKRKLVIKGFALLAIAVLLGTIPMGAHADNNYYKVDFGKEYTLHIGGDTNILYFDAHANQTIVISVLCKEYHPFWIELNLGDMHPPERVKEWEMKNYYPKITKQYVNLYYNVTSEDVKKYGDGKTVTVYVWDTGVPGTEYKIKINTYDKGMGAFNTFMIAMIVGGIVLAVVVAVAVVLWRKKR